MTTSDSTDPTQQFRLDGKVALVTGASSGIGSRLAQVFESAGAQVVAVARRRERLAELAGRTSIRPVSCDITDETQCEAAVASSIAEFGRIDVLVNCAGVSEIVPAEDQTREDFARIVDVNLVSTFAFTRLVAREMLARDGGSIVNIASIVGLVGLGRMPQASYAASKGGVVNLTRELAAQWARKGLRVNGIAPAFFDTEMTEGLFGNEHGEKWVASMTPMGRGGRLEELDGAALFLASDASTYVTGATIPVDGGWTAV